MLLPDVNILIYAHVEDSSPDHPAYADWVTRLATGPEPFALSVLVLAGFVRIATNPQIFDPPSTTGTAFAFVSSLVERPTARIVGPGPDHLTIFEHLCRESAATGKTGGGRSTRGGGHRARVHDCVHRRRLQPISGAPLAPSATSLGTIGRERESAPQSHPLRLSPLRGERLG